MTVDQMKDVIRNRKAYCTEENFIGIGSTRKTYSRGGMVIKIHLYPIGYLQFKMKRIFTAP
ncbi:hypothetical protein SAMN04488126_11278 [Bhargavaea beijingensis]|uniref:Uncharacterized protein n=1 Tax=Bhargavaea beijingensis TaxID=426756 RepID=A0A1G7E5Z1_9BACL|nr:hypothetical protein SAMN04488126_11278 [Bhargavaea beijingensis]